jgi:hypothetical protein
MVRGGKTVLTVGRKQFEAGNLITVPDAGRDFVLEVAAISSSTFTLRYQNVEYTRPIRATR